MNIRFTYLCLCPLLFCMATALKSDDALRDDKPNSFRTQNTQPGPWGIIEYSRLVLEPSDHYIKLSTDLEDPGSETVWAILSDSPEGVCRTLADAGFETDKVASLTSSDQMVQNPATGWFEITPGEKVILEMTSEQRSKLYPQLQPQKPENPFYQPFALPPGGIREITTTPTGLSERTISLIEQLTYSKSKAKRFSDIRLIFSKTDSYEEKVRILKVIGREPDLSARLIVNVQSDLASLEKYWGAGGRNRESLPMLRSVLAAEGVDRLDIAHLLPPTPRKLIHTYPTPWGYGIGTDMPDCFWTAFSFFSDDPPDRHLDFTAHVFEERYETALPPFQFGDLILISDAETGEWIHACNLIADELVFTKNGRSMGRAWIISTLPEVVNSYFNTENVRVSLHRLKPEFLR